MVGIKRKTIEITNVFTKTGKLFSTESVRFLDDEITDRVLIENRAVLNIGDEEKRLSMDDLFDKYGNITVPVLKDDYSKVRIFNVGATQNTIVKYNTNYNNDAIMFQVYDESVFDRDIDRYCNFKNYAHSTDLGDDNYKLSFIKSMVYRFRTPTDDPRQAVLLQVIEVINEGNISHNIIISSRYATGDATYEICNIPFRNYNTPKVLNNILMAVYDEQYEFHSNIRKKVNLKDIDEIINTIDKDRVILSIYKPGSTMVRYENLETPDSDIVVKYIAKAASKSMVSVTRDGNKMIENTVMDNANINDIFNAIADMAKLGLKL